MAGTSQSLSMKAIEMRKESEEQTETNRPGARDHRQSVVVNWYESEGFKVWLSLAGHQADRKH
jgi:hypothetical protein